MKETSVTLRIVVMSLAIFCASAKAQSGESKFDSQAADAGMELAKGVDLPRVIAAMGLNKTTETAIRVFGMLYGDAVPFVRGPNGEFYGTRNKQAFVAALDNISRARLARTNKLIASPDTFVAFRTLLRASSAFVLTPKDSDGNFNAAVFNKRFDTLNDTQLTGTEEERVKAFLELMKP